jgi:IclR family acetate operon transcriptional repressor
MANSDLIQSLLRGLRILDLLSASPAGLRLSEISKELQVKDPTAHNLLRTLLSQSYVVKSTEKLYRLGPAARALGGGETDPAFGEAVKEEMLRLASRLPGRTLTYCTVVARRIKTLFRIYSDVPTVVQEPEDRFLHLYGNASGLAFQAFAESGDLVRELREEAPFYEYGAHLWGTPSKLDEFLRHARVKGYAAPEFEQAEIVCLAAPVCDASRNMIGALGCSCGSGEMTSEPGRAEMVDHTLKSARRMTEMRQNM